MRSRIYILLMLAFASLTVCAQCPPPDSLKKSVINKKIGALLPAEQLPILRNYQSVLLKCGAGKDTTYAWLVFQLGWAYHDLGDYLTGSQLFSESIAISAGIPNFPQSILLTRYYWLSTIYDSLKNINAKRRAIDSCISVAERFGHPEDISALRCLATRLQYFFDVGDYKLCINDAQLCEKRAVDYLATAIKPDTNAGRGIAENAFHWHINALLELKQYDEAESLLAGKLEEYRKEKLPNFLALTYAQLAELNVRRGQYDKGLEGFTHALGIYQKNNNQFNTKQTFNNIGEKIWLNHENNYAKALLCFRQALSCRNNDPKFAVEDTIESLNINRNIADVFLRQKKFDSAFFYYQRAFDQLQKGAGPAVILAGMQGEFPRYKKSDYLFELMTDYANAFREKYLSTQDRNALSKSLAVCYDTDLLLSRLNLSQFDPVSKLYWRKAAKKFYENAIETCWLAGDGTRAFHFFERSRAVLLNGQVSEQNWLRQEELSALNKLRKAQLETTLSMQALKPGDKAWTVLNDSLKSLNEKLYNQTQQIKFRNTLFSQSEDSAVTTLTMLRQKVLGTETALVEMFSGDSSLFMLFLDKEQASILKIDKPRFDSLQAGFQHYLSHHDLLNRNFNAFVTVAARLYRTMFQSAPVLRKRLIISPDGSYFPFEALVVAVVNGRPEYLLAQQIISYTYSARFLLYTDQRGYAASGNFLGLAPVTYPDSLHLAELPGSDLSVQHIAGTMKSALALTGQAATRQAFLQEFAKYTVNQLYTHASDSSDRREPVIYFHDAPLYLSELIPETKPATRLIVLSACETGKGKVYEGEGAFTLNRGFAAMGIYSSVTNLWAVNNRSAYAIAELFYKYMQKGMPLDLALQKAKLEFMNDESGENKLPCYWAAPILVGKTDSIPLAHPLAWKEIAGAMLLLVAGVLLCIWKFRRKPSPVPGTA